MEHSGGEIQTDLEFQLLTDADGIYGFGFRPIGDQQGDDFNNPISDIVLRADLITPDTYDSHPTFVFEPFEEGNSPKSPDYSSSLEKTFVHIQTTLIAQRNGISTSHFESFFDVANPEEWAPFPIEYEPYQKEALTKVGSVIRTAYDNCVAPSLLPLLWQLSSKWRYGAYTRMQGSPRFSQLLVVFPVLALKLIQCPSLSIGTGGNLARANSMVEDGAKLNKIAETAKVPSVMRKIGIYEAHRYVDFTNMLFDYRLYLPDFWDQNSGDIYSWLRAVYHAPFFGNKDYTDYAVWLVRNFHEFSAEYKTRQVQSNIQDWIYASYEGSGLYTLDRPFVKSMSAQTVQQLSDEWHQGLGRNYDAILGVNQPGNWYENPEAERYETEKEYVESLRMKIAANTYPIPWIDDAEINGIFFKATTNELELIEASQHLRNCGGSYSERLHRGWCCIYTASRGTEFLAMIEVQRHARGFHVTQCAGYLNQAVSTEVSEAVKDWETSFPTRPEPTWEEIYTSDNWELEIVPPAFDEWQSA